MVGIDSTGLDSDGLEKWEVESQSQPGKDWKTGRLEGHLGISASDLDGPEADQIYRKKRKISTRCLMISIRGCERNLSSFLSSCRNRLHDHLADG